METIKIGIIGSAGKMGQKLSAMAIEKGGFELSGGLERSGSEYVGKDLGKLLGYNGIGVIISDNAEDVISASDAIIDFTTPESTLKCAEIAARLGKIHVIGTTGLSPNQEATLAEYAKKTVILHSHNMSIGINLLETLVEKTARLLKDESFDIEIVEMHHKLKVDAPSGTAITLGKAAASGLERDLDDVACYTRKGLTGKRPSGEIGFATLRGGTVVGDHTVIFAGDNERIELTHRAADRNIFASGAFLAAKWCIGKDAGLYSMKDVLAL